MYNVEVMVEQPQCASVYKELALISEQPLTRIDIAYQLEIQVIVLKFGNTRLINKMKFKGHTLIWDHINL